MADQNPTAYELFTRFAPKFRQVMEWEPSGFYIRSEAHRFDFCLKNMTGVTFYSLHSLDISTADLDFTFKYDPKNKLSPAIQMNLACWSAILEGPFKGRKFYMEPAEGEAQRAFSTLGSSGREGQMTIKFSHDGSPIPGLDLKNNMRANHWSVFVPPTTREGKAIDAAIRFEQAIHQQNKLHKELIFPTVDECLATLQQSLEAVASAG